MRRSELPIDAEPRADVVVLDTIGELATSTSSARWCSSAGSLVRHRRPQHPRAGGVRQADRVRPAHGELRRDRGGVRRQRRRRAGGRRGRARGRRCSALMTDPVRRARLGAAARALVEANRGAKDKTLAVLDALLPPQRSAYPSNVRPFRAALNPFTHGTKHRGRRGARWPGATTENTAVFEGGATPPGGMHRRPNADLMCDPGSMLHSCTDSSPARRAGTSAGRPGGSPGPSSASATSASAARARRRWSPPWPRGCGAGRAAGDPLARLRAPRSDAPSRRWSRMAHVCSLESAPPATSR